MPIIPFPGRHWHEESDQIQTPHREVRINGTFLSPTGRVGTMTGCLRLDRFIMVSHRLCVIGVFAGVLLDVEGTTIGWGSRRKTVRVEIIRDPRELAAVIGPVDVDLMGITVSVRAFTIHPGARMRPYLLRFLPETPRPGLQLHVSAVPVILLAIAGPLGIGLVPALRISKRGRWPDRSGQRGGRGLHALLRRHAPGGNPHSPTGRTPLSVHVWRTAGCASTRVRAAIRRSSPARVRVSPYRTGGSPPRWLRVLPQRHVRGVAGARDRGRSSPPLVT
jgi:hypothetical protein